MEPFYNTKNVRSFQSVTKHLCIYLSYLILSEGHIFLAELKNGLPGSHIQRISFLTQQQRGVVEDVGLRKLHQIQIWAKKPTDYVSLPQKMRTSACLPALTHKQS